MALPTRQVSWLLALNASHPAFLSNRGQWPLSPPHEEMSCLSVTVARLRRFRTDFPILPDFLSRPPSVNIIFVLAFLSIPTTFLRCQHLTLTWAGHHSVIVFCNTAHGVLHHPQVNNSL